MATSVRTVLIALIFLLINSGNAFPQVRPDAGTLLQEQQKTQPRGLERMSPWEAPEKEREQLQETGVKFLVRGFRFTGIEGLATEAELSELLKDAVGKQFGLTGLKRLADRVTKHLQKKGWFLARAYVPKQEIKDGIVEIAVIAGKVEGAPRIRGENLRISEDRLRKMAEPLVREGEAAKQQDIARALLLMNDLPGIRASSTFEPGEAKETARLVVDAKEGPLVSAKAWGDNYGSRFTGTWRGSGLVQINDPFGWADQISLNSTDNPNYQYGQAGYSIPIGYRGMTAGVSYSEMRYTLDNDLIPLDLEGGSRVVDLALNYPITRSRTANLWTGVRYDWKHLWDDALGERIDDKRTNSGSVLLYGDLLDTWFGGGYNTGTAGLTGGVLSLSGVGADALADSLTARSDGTYGKFTFGASRLQKVYDRLSLFVSVTGQQSLDNLDSSEKFILGGPNGVRAYPIGEASGDGGGIFTTELRYDFPEVWKLGFPQLVGFYDLGWTSLHEVPWTNSGTAFDNENSYSISGAGIGLNLNKPGVYTIRAAWAAKIGTNPGRSLNGTDADGQSEDNRFWIQALVMF